MVKSVPRYRVAEQNETAKAKRGITGGWRGYKRRKKFRSIFVINSEASLLKINLQSKRVIRLFLVVLATECERRDT